MKYNIITIILMMLLTSCKNFLDVTPTDFLSPENYYNNDDEALAGLAGVYDALGNGDALYGQNLWLHFAMANDLEYIGKSYIKTGYMLIYNYDASNPYLEATWAGLYEGINRANSFISSIKEADNVDEDIRLRYEGEARFLRALFYFHLVCNWGDVPLRLDATTSVDDVNIALTDKDSIYSVILDDLQFAQENVLSADEVPTSGRVSKSAVWGMLARVYLKMAGYPLLETDHYKDAKYWAQKVIDSGLHELNPDYAQIFINIAEDLYDIKESIFEVEFYGNNVSESETGRVGGIMGLKSVNYDIGYSYAWVYPTPRLWFLYDETDVRRDWNIAPYEYDDADSEEKTYLGSKDLRRSAGKFRREYEPYSTKDKNYTNQNFPVLRYSDVLLMFAEADNELNGPTDSAYYALNLVRERAGISSVSDLSQNEFRSLIKDERGRELCFEAIRKFDLIRWGDFYDEMKETGKEISSLSGYSIYNYTYAFDNVSTPRDLWVPYPLSETSLNNAITTQTPGW